MHTGIDFKSVVHILSKHIQDLRNQELSIRRALQRVKDLAGQEWRKSRYYLLISSLSTSKYDVNNHITQGLAIIKSLGYYGSAANGKHADYSVPDLVALARQENYHTLTTNAYKDTGDTTKMIQRSEDWFELRKSAPVTGSNLNRALGLDGLKKQHQYFDEIIHGTVSQEFSEAQKQAMSFGTEHEIDAIATLVGRIIPFYYPVVVFREEGCSVLDYGGENILVSSPDGSMGTSTTSPPVMVYETKCKPSNPHTTAVYYKIPKYYILQILAEMASYCSKLVFTCWSIQSTAFLRCSLIMISGRLFLMKSAWFTIHTALNAQHVVRSDLWKLKRG